MSVDPRNTRPPLRETRVWVVVLLTAAAALPVLVHAAATVRLPGSGRAAFVVVALLALGVELVPLATAGGRTPGGVAISTAFAFAILLEWGLAPALIVRLAGAFLFSVSQRWAWWRTTFNLSQYAVSWALAALALDLTRDALGRGPGPLEGADLAPVAAAGVTFLVANALLVTIMIGAFQHRTVRAVVRRELPQKLLVNGALLALAPLIVLAAERSAWLVPLSVIALLAVRAVASFSARQEYAAQHDVLTGLPNRQMFESRAREAVADAVAGRDPLALLLVDLDRFKEVNDALGHPAGDELLRQVAARLRDTAGQDTTVARLGGDEFALLLTGRSQDDAVIAAEDLAQRLGAALTQPFPLERVPVGVTASIGIAVCPGQATRVEDLLNRADAAMYAAKRGSGPYLLSPVGADRTTPDQLALLGELVGAVAQDPAAGSLVLHYQPLVAVGDGSVVGVEALLRWHHPRRGLLRPGEFLPVTGHGALLHQLTRRVLELALDQRRRWAEDGLRLPIAVNVTAWDLSDPEFPAWLADRLARHRVEARDLTLEVAETAVMAETAGLVATLRDLHARGVTVSLDDFGTGYASLTHLRRLPVTEVKIDRSFVTRMCVEAGDEVVVRSILELARSLGLRVVAEGVEDAAVHAALAVAGCPRAQGNHYSPPLPPELVPDRVRAGRREPARLSGGRPGPS